MYGFTNVERIIGLVTGCILTFDAVLLLRTSAHVDWLSYGLLFAVSLAMLAIGSFMRLRGASERWAMPLIGIALYGMFGVAIALFNYLLLPVGDRLIDPLLIATDASLGFVWPHYVESFLDFPAVGQALGHVYMSSLGQLLFVILVLGSLQLRTKLNEFLLTGMIACSITVAIWFAMPSTGPSAHFSLSADVTEKLGMVVDPQYGAKVKQLVVTGPELISPKTDLGLVAFPSFHTVMALLAVWFSRRGALPLRSRDSAQHSDDTRHPASRWTLFDGCPGWCGPVRFVSVARKMGVGSRWQRSFHQNFNCVRVS